MREIKLKDRNLGGDISLSNYLQLCGIKEADCDSFLIAPKKADELNPILLKNMHLAAKTAYEKLQQGAEVFIQVDSDMDGWTSACELIQYIQIRFPQVKVTWRLHTGKQHGIIVDTVPQTASLVFIPDAGSNQVEELTTLVRQGKTVIVLDHHQIEQPELSENCGAIIVNNQVSPDFPNKNLSGAGVVYKFLQYLDQQYFKDDLYRQFTDIAALGILADAMDMRELDNNFIAYEGLNHIHNKLVKAIINQQAGDGMYARIADKEAPTKTEAVFYIAPVFNGLIRYGEQEEKEKVFEAFVTPDSSEIVETIYRGVKRSESLYDYCARIAKNAKSRQDNAKKKSMTLLSEKINNENHDKDNIVIVTLDKTEADKVSPNITGLAAMELVKEYNRPVLVLREVEVEQEDKTKKILFSGSGRNGNFNGFESLLNFLRTSNLVDFAQGHDGAFGVMIAPEKIDLLRQYAEKTIDKNLFENQYCLVDFFFHSQQEINVNGLAEFANGQRIYCGAIPSPIFGFEFDIDANNCTLMGKESTTIKVKTQFCDFIIFKRPDIAATVVENRGSQIHIKMIGKPEISSYGQLQIMVSDCEVTNIIAQSVPAAAKRTALDLI